MPDMLGAWLPLAMANAIQAIYASGGGTPPETRDILASWGLWAMASEMDAERDAITDRTISMLED